LIIVFRVKRLFWCLNVNINLAFRVRHNFKQFSQYTGTKRGEGRERTFHTRASSDENYLKSIFGSVSYGEVILRTTPHWSVKITSCNFRLLKSEQQIKITFLEWVRTNNKFKIIIVGHGDSLSYFILS